MNRTEYLAEIGRSLRFLGAAARTEALADMAELYDGLSGRGLTDVEVRQRIGSPDEVAAEYRLVEELDRVDRSPGPASGLRIGLASLSGRTVRGVAFQLLGIVWFALAIVALGAGLCGLAGLGVSVGAAAGFDPLVTTLAVPGIPPVSGVFLGLAIAAAAVALLLANRIMMRALSRLMRAQLHRRHTTIGAGDDSDDLRAGNRPAGRYWINSRRTVWLTAVGALALAALSAALVPLVAAPEFPRIVDRTERLELQDATNVEIRAQAVDLRLTLGRPPSATLTANLRRTFAQSVNLQVTGNSSITVIEAAYREGLSWGINPRPVLTVTVPSEGTGQVVVRLRGGAEMDISGLPADLSDRLTVER